MRHTLPRNVTRSLFQTALIVCAVVPATTRTAGGAGSELRQKVAKFAWERGVKCPILAD